MNLSTATRTTLSNSASVHGDSAESADARHTRAVERRRLAAERAGAALQADGLLRLPEVLVLVPVSASTFWANIASGRFPAGVRLSARCTAWRASDIRALLARLSNGAAP